MTAESKIFFPMLAEFTEVTSGAVDVEASWMGGRLPSSPRRVVDDSEGKAIGGGD